MRESDLKEIVREFNLETTTVCIAAQPIGDNVQFGHVWTTSNFYNLADTSPYLFYFITYESKCIGVVHKMGNDLHWYICPEHRKQGHLTRALQNVILPHLSGLKQNQRITIERDGIGDDNFKASYAVAVNVSFRPMIENEILVEAFLDLRNYRKIPVKNELLGTTHEHIATLRKKVNVAIGNLEQVSSEITMSLVESKETRKLKRIIKDLEKYRTTTHDDILYEFDDLHKKKGN